MNFFFVYVNELIHQGVNITFKRPWPAENIKRTITYILRYNAENISLNMFGYGQKYYLL